MQEYSDEKQPNIKKLSKELIGEDIPSIEFAPESSNDDDIVKYIDMLYRDSVTEIEKHRVEWEANKKAYSARSVDQHNFDDAIVDEDNMPQVYCSAIVADKVEDVVAIQLSGRPTVYPLPHVNPQFNYESYLTETDDTPDIFTRNLWSFCFKDLQERRNMQELNIKFATDSRLFGFTVAKICQEYDFDVQDQDVSIKICEPGSVMFGFDSDNNDRFNYVFHRTWKSVFQAITKYPKFKDDIISAVGGNSNLLSVNIPQEERAKCKNKVCIVEGYLRDLTKINDEVQIQTQDEYGNNTYQYGTEEVYKYPTGRKVVFIEQANGIKILEDGENPYNKFPFEIFASKPVSWDYVGRNEASPLRALQFADDYVFQQMMANIKKLGNGVMVYDRKGIQDPDLIEMKVGEMIPVDYMGAIQFEISKGITTDAERAHNLILQAAREISGVEAVSEGKPAGSITSGIGISLLQESTNRKVRVASDVYAEFLQRVWKQAADIMIDIYKAGRKLRCSDTDGIAVTLPVDLYEVTDAIDVAVDSFTALALDPVSMSNLALSLLQVKDQNGMPIIDRKLLAEWLKIPGLREAMKRISVESMQRRQEEMQMQQLQMQGNGKQGGLPEQQGDMGQLAQPDMVNVPDEMPLNMEMGGMQEGTPGLDTMSADQIASMLGGMA